MKRMFSGIQKEYPRIQSKKLAGVWTEVGQSGEIFIKKRKVLGTGGYGKVFLGKYRDREVAVKRMDRDDVDLFMKEIEILQNSSYGHVVEYFFHDEDDEYLYLVLEKCDLDLATFLIARTITSHDVDEMEMMLETVCGLSYLHSKNIVHRDIKLSNFLVKFNRYGPVIKLSDFGISRTLRPDRTSTAASEKGTVGYKASEILRGLRLRKVSDVFALGIVFYKILTDVEAHPFGDNNIDIQVRVRDRKPPDLTKIDGESDGESYRILIGGMLRHDTARRLRSEEVKYFLEEMENSKIANSGKYV